VYQHTLKASLIPEQDWKQHRTGHHTVNRGCVYSEVKAPDDGQNITRNILSGVQVNKQNLFKFLKVIACLVSVLSHFIYLEDERNYKPKIQ
jgi:hypothetical protein